MTWSYEITNPELSRFFHEIGSSLKTILGLGKNVTPNLQIGTTYLLISYLSFLKTNRNFSDKIGR